MEIVNLSKRLQAVADMVTSGNVVADIGTDHGYLPIHLIQSKKTDKVIAMDVNKGPLQKAKENMTACGVLDKIELRLSDGLCALLKGEADTITISGMGGKLISRILEDGKEYITPDTELILSPQSEIQQFREYLRDNGYITIMEDMLCEDGKYYVIIKCRLLQGGTKEDVCESDNHSLDNCSTDSIDELVHMKFGKYLLECKNPALKDYILREQRTTESVLKEICEFSTEQVATRRKQLENELKWIKRGLEYYEM